ncbi:hypothetical protein [Bythopirellula polymerisocia]|uniref:PEP-CTERM protein-sorting domain-containing protein n=1 Tax=Bythopirellula polymerisocia TaxID=2528003 RepID=A0A5C6CV76_9BACT|nr:hypothetical protein [Bythopirellula polymerisocia]TWU27417.1 hypothetical protein Pla144_21900 [Bythopirellula polymerisocia]
MKFSHFLTSLLVLFGVSCESRLFAATFLFGSDGVRNTLVGLSDASVTVDGVTMSLTAGPSGALLDDTDSQGLGIDARSLPGALDSTSGDRTKLNILEGTNNSTSSGESLSFSFNKAGVLQDLLFDGVKDETLEYFLLTFPNGTTVTIFDSQTEYRLDLQGFHLTDLSVPSPIECQLEDDDLTGINYTFQAGEIFSITYGEGNFGDVPGYRTNPNVPLQFPNSLGNGARLQGMVVATVPEPAASAIIVLLACIGVGARPNYRNSRP